MFMDIFAKVFVYIFRLTYPFPDHFCAACNIFAARLQRAFVLRTDSICSPFTNFEMTYDRRGKPSAKFHFSEPANEPVI